MQNNDTIQFGQNSISSETEWRKRQPKTKFIYGRSL